MIYYHLQLPRDDTNLNQLFVKCFHEQEKKSWKNSSPFLKIISTPSPSQFSSKEIPGEMEVLEMCPTDDSSRFTATEGSQTPSGTAMAAGPSHTSSAHGHHFSPGYTQPHCKQKSHPWGPEDLTPSFVQKGSTSCGRLSARCGVTCTRDHALKSVPSAPPSVCLKFRSPLWSALPKTERLSQHSSNGLFEDKDIWPISNKISPTRSVDLMQSCQFHIALPQGEGQQTDMELWTSQPLYWTMWGVASAQHQPSPLSQQYQRNSAGPTPVCSSLIIPLCSQTQPTLIVYDVLKTTQLELQSIQRWIKITIELSEATLLAKKISSGKIPPLGSFAAKDQPIGFMTDSMPHIRLNSYG